MNILFAGDNDTVVEYLIGAGYRVKHLYANDLALKAALEFECEVVVYFSTVKELVSHEEVIRELQGNGIRVILVVEPDDPLLIYATALGVSDILIFPMLPEDILDLIKNPAKASNTADLVRNCWQKTFKMNLDKNDRAIEHAGISEDYTNAQDERTGFFRNISARVGRLTNHVLKTHSKKKRSTSEDKQHSKISVYVIFGDYSADIADYLSGEFDIAGYSDILKPAVSYEMVNKPDIFLVLGTAVVADNSSLYEQALLESLDNLRISCPDSIIKLIYNDQVDENIVKKVLQIGNCEVHKINELAVENLPELIRACKGCTVYTKESIDDAVRQAELKQIQSSQKVEIPQMMVLETSASNEITDKVKQSNKNIPVKEEQQNISKKVIFNVPFTKRSRSKIHGKDSVMFVSHPVITVWNPTGTNKSITALNLAVTAAGRGLDAALIELDLSCPLLDRWFEIPQTAVADCGNGVQGAGIMTLGENLMPGHIPKLFCKSWGVRYLAAGNKLGNIGTPDLTLENLEQIIRAVYQRDVKGKPAITVIDAGASYEWPATFAALKQATVLLVPVDGSPQEVELVKQQLTELSRVGVKPKSVEVLWDTPGMKRVKQLCESRIIVPADTPGYIKAAADNKPYCLSAAGAEVWRNVLEGLL